jgi:hypothetical protein
MRAPQGRKGVLEDDDLEAERNILRLRGLLGDGCRREGMLPCQKTAAHFIPDRSNVHQDFQSATVLARVMLTKGTHCSR